MSKIKLTFQKKFLNYYFLLFFISLVLRQLLSSFELIDIHGKANDYSFFISSYIINLKNYLPEIFLINFTHVVLPLTITYFLFRIYICYVSKLWAVFLALLSISAFSDYSFQTFLIDLFSLNILSNPPLVKSLLISEFPIQSISILIFLILFYNISIIKFYDKFLFLFYTFLVSFFFYLNSLDSVFLLLYFCIFSLNKILKIKSMNFKAKIKMFLFQVFLILLIISPNLYFEYNFNEISIENLKINWLYYILPVVSVLILFIIKRIDIYELWFKFKAVFLFFSFEFGLVLLSTEKSMFENQIPQYFLHAFYFVPLIHYISRPSIIYKRGIESTANITFFRNLILKFFKFTELPFLFLFILLILLYNFYFLIFIL